jgi:hypothetical protein
MEAIAADTPQSPSELKRRLLWLMPELGLSPVGVTHLDHALAMYLPESGQIWYVGNLRDDQWSAGVLHELGHVSLHPPASGNYDNTHAPDDLEEHLVHLAAEQVWRSFGLDGYIELMRSIGVPERLLEPVSAAYQATVTGIAAWVGAAVRNPSNPPEFLSMTVLDR